MKPDILESLEEHRVRYEVESDLNRVIGEVEHALPDAELGGTDSGRGSQRPAPVCDRFGAVQRMKGDALIMHPLPRTAELKSVDDDPRALYFRQARNGLFVRMALLTMLLEGN